MSIHFIFQKLRLTLKLSLAINKLA